jgi:hypothetical protein
MGEPSLSFVSLIQKTPEAAVNEPLVYETKIRSFTVQKQEMIVQEPIIVPEKTRLFNVKDFSPIDEDERILLEIAAESRLLDQQKFIFDTLTALDAISDGKRVDPKKLQGNPLMDIQCRDQNRAEYTLLRSKLEQIREP